MKTTRVLTLIATVIAVCALVQATAWAGGIDLYEITTPDVGLASAGYAAGSQDASTLYKNPAGMSFLNEAQLQASLQVLYGNVQFSENSQTTVAGGNGNNAVGTLPGASVFITYPVTQKLSVGFGTFSYFGLSEDYGDSWAGRYYAEKGTLVGVSLMPAASFKVNDWLSIGAGLNAMYGYLDTQVALRQTDVVGDGQMKLNDNTWGFGGNGGILIQPRSGTRIGVNYLSQVKLDFQAKPSFSNLGPILSGILANPQTLDLGVTVPQSVMGGIYQELNDKWALMADVGWQNWSRFGEVSVGYDPAQSGLTAQLHYEDTWHGAIGARYRATDHWSFTGGVAYDTSAVSDANRTVTLPMGKVYRFGVGAYWRVSQSVDLGAAYELAWSGDLPVTQSSVYRGTVSGTYNNLCL
jgi:long-chain fatty acid transport protein